MTRAGLSADDDATCLPPALLINHGSDLVDVKFGLSLLSPLRRKVEQGLVLPRVLLVGVRLSGEVGVVEESLLGDDLVLAAGLPVLVAIRPGRRVSIGQWRRCRFGYPTSV